MIQKIKSKISGMFSKKNGLIIDRKERERITRDFIKDIEESMEDGPRKEASIKFLKAVGLGKPARNTSKT